MTMKFDMVDNARQGTVIKVVGVGGAGGNAVQHMINKGVKGVEFIAANTDAQALNNSSADNVIQIGDSGMGAGARPEVGRQLAEESRARIEDALRGADMVFIAAGMGGGTGTGASPIVAEVAKSLGALTVAVVSKPFAYEGEPCMELAEEGLKALEGNVDSLIVILNEKLEEMYEDATMMEWFEYADDVLNNAVAGIAEIITSSGKMNMDFEDVKTIMREQGKAMMGTAVASGIDRARIAAEQAINSPLLDGVDLSGARGILVNITGNTKLKGKEIKEVMSTVRAFAAKDATIIQGLVYNEDMGEDIRVTVVATGLGKNKKPVHLVPEIQQRTGTHDIPVFTESSDPGIASPAGASRFDGMKSATWRFGNATDMVQAMERNGVEATEIPAYLRKQAD